MSKRRKTLFRLLPAALAAVLLAGCALPELTLLPQAQPAENRTNAPPPPSETPCLIVAAETGGPDGFSALLDAYAASQGIEVELFGPGEVLKNKTPGLVLLARQPDPANSNFLDLAAEPLLGVLAQSAAVLPGLETKTGCPALPLGLDGYGYLADGALLAALLGEAFTPACLQNASWAEWKDFIETLGGWIEAPAETDVTLAGERFTLPAEPPAAAQNLTGVFALPAAEDETFSGSAFSPALCAAFAGAEDINADPDRLTGPLNSVFAAFQIELDWLAGPQGRLQPADAAGQGLQDAAALLESGWAVFCRARTGALARCCAEEFSARLVLTPVKYPFDETDLAPDAAFALEQLGGWPVAVTPGWLAIPAGADAEQQTLAESFLLWVFTSAEGQQALKDTLGALSVTGGEPDSPALRTASDALTAQQALPDLAQGLPYPVRRSANLLFYEGCVDTQDAAPLTRGEYVAALLELLGGE